ncbi:MAG: heptosyltransferase [Verrucomicrobiota bacterium]
MSGLRTANRNGLCSGHKWLVSGMVEQSSSLPADSILVRGVNWLGDAVMITPALQRLRERFPKANITLLTHEKLADLWQNHPNLDRVLTFAAGESPWSIGRRLRAEGFQTALVLPNSPRSALEVWLARIPRRVGYGRAWRNWFLTQTIPPRRGQVHMHKRSVREIKRLIRLPAPAARNTEHGTRNPHQIHDYLHLAAALGADEAPLAPHLHVTAPELEKVAQRFGLQTGPQPNQTQPLFGLNAGAEYGPAKRWPSERFVAAAREIQQRTNCRWLIFGGKSDASLAGEIESAIGAAQPALNLAGQTSLREFMGLLKLCRVLLTNDTGPMHVAAALGTTVVVPFGSTSPELTGPAVSGDIRHQLLQSEAPCSPCFRRSCPIDFRCMTGISVESVVAAVLRAV